jgi:hypothetical protein
VSCVLVIIGKKLVLRDVRHTKNVESAYPSFFGVPRRGKVRDSPMRQPFADSSELRKAQRKPLNNRKGKWSQEVTSNFHTISFLLAQRKPLNNKRGKWSQDVTSNFHTRAKFTIIWKQENLVRNDYFEMDKGALQYIGVL